MGEHQGDWHINWTVYSQMKLEAESEQRNKIVALIHEYSRMCTEQGISNYFISGLEVAAGIVARGDLPKPEPQEQNEELV